MQGFFTRKETESKTRPTGKIHSCFSCGLYREVTTPKMKPFGNFKKGIMNIGEAPGEVEDDRSKQWQGKAGRVLKNIYKELGIDLFEDCININAVNCRPIDEVGKNAKPTSHQIDCCRDMMVLKAIKQYKPKVIILLGESAVTSIIGYRWKKNLGGNENGTSKKSGIISKWRGWAIPDQDFQTWICPTFHPSYVIREDKPEIDTIWKLDLEQAFEYVKKPFPVWKEPNIETITDLSIFDNPKFGRSKYFVMNQAVLDFETTGLKPHAKGHEIICAAIADTEDHAYAFMMPKTRRELRPFLNFLKNEKIAKVAQNMKYEHTWAKVLLRCEIKPWAWDTMQATHIQDNRSGVTGLKFQNYVTFGIVDYDSEIAPYLRCKDGSSANNINRIHELLKLPGGKEKLLKYCGWDAVIESRLSILQRKLFEPKLGGKK